MTISTLADAIVEIYAQVAAPSWAARNLDALADVLHDLSWRREGPVELRLSDLDGMVPQDSIRLTTVLRSVADETAGSAHPVRVHYS